MQQATIFFPLLSSPVVLCSYTLSAKTGQNLKDTFLRIAADLSGIPLTQQQLNEALQAQMECKEPLAMHTESLLQQRQPGSAVGNQQATDVICTGQDNGAHSTNCGPPSRTVGHTATAAAAAAEAGSDICCAGCIRLRVSRRQQEVAVMNSKRTSKEQQKEDDCKRGFAMCLMLQWCKRYRCCVWSQRVRSL